MPLFEGCPPAQWTKPLSRDFKSAIDPFLPVLRIVWRVALGFSHDAWQVDVIRCVFEINPATGKLRWRQYLVSMARQQGKSEIAAAIAILLLLWKPLALVIGIASSADQARIVYQRTLNVIRSAPKFARLFRKATEGRGIERDRGGVYAIKAAKGAALQGLAIDLGVVDEVHLLKSELWTALVNGTGGRDDSLVCGITTAGDDDSELLKHLYAEGEAGRIGFLLWQAPDRTEYTGNTLPTSDAVLWADLCAAGPAYATGRVPRENVLADVRTLPPQDAIRYRLNRWVTGTDHALMPLALWHGRATGAEWPAGATVTFGLDRSPGWEYAAVVAAVKAPDGSLHTQLVASVVAPTPETLASLCGELATANPGCRFALDGYTLGSVGKALKGKGLTVFQASLSEVTGASSLLYAATAQGRLNHPGDPLLTVQMPATRRKTTGDGFKISRADSEANIDAVIATALAIYFADTNTQTLPTLYVA